MRFHINGNHRNQNYADYKNNRGREDIRGALFNFSVCFITACVQNCTYDKGDKACRKPDCGIYHGNIQVTFRKVHDKAFKRYDAKHNKRRIKQCLAHIKVTAFHRRCGNGRGRSRFLLCRYYGCIMILRSAQRTDCVQTDTVFLRAF